MSVQTLPSSLHSLLTEIVRSPCGDWPSHGARAGIVQCHLRRVYGLRSYDFSKFVKLLAKPNRRGRGARESIRKSHSRLLPPQGGLTEAARKGGDGQDTGSVDPSQAKCELGISCDKPRIWSEFRSSIIIFCKRQNLISSSWCLISRFKDRWRAIGHPYCPHEVISESTWIYLTLF